MKKHIVCFGDSNTHGCCADPADCADHGDRFNEDERWTCLLQKALGDSCLVLEEGLSGRTTVFPDPLHEGMSGLDVIYPVLMSHEPVDLLIIMLGTNDTKDRFSAASTCIARGMERLAMKAETVPCWGGKKPKLLILAPPHIGIELQDPSMGKHCHARSAGLAAAYEPICRSHGWAFLDVHGLAEFNRVDYMHLSAKGHRQLAAQLTPLVQELLSHD